MGSSAKWLLLLWVQQCDFYGQRHGATHHLKPQHIYNKKVSSYCLLYPLLNWFKLVYGLFLQSKMHSTYSFCSTQPILARKELNVQADNCQNLLFLHQLTQNMTTDSSLNHVFSTWKFKAQNILGTQIVFCFAIQSNLCAQHVLSLEFSCTEQYFVILWVSWNTNKCFWKRFTCTKAKE